MSAEVFEYEVEAAIIDKRTQTRDVRTFTVWAYRIQDVITQLGWTVLAESSNPDAIDLKVLRIGPPKRLIDLACQEIAAAISRNIATIAELTGKVTSS